MGTMTKRTLTTLTNFGMYEGNDDDITTDQSNMRNKSKDSLVLSRKQRSRTVAIVRCTEYFLIKHFLSTSTSRLKSINRIDSLVVKYLPSKQMSGVRFPVNALSFLLFVSF